MPRDSLNRRIVKAARGHFVRHHQSAKKKESEKFAIARAQSPAREARALPSRSSTILLPTN